MTEPSRTDRLIEVVEAELEAQRAALDAGTPLTCVTIFVDLHPSGDVRRVKFRTDADRDRRVTGRRLLAMQAREGK